MDPPAFGSVAASMGGRVAVLVSGGGTNLQALLDDPQVAPHIALVLADRPHVRALERAAARDVAVEVVEVDAHADRDTYTEAVRDVLLWGTTAWTASNRAPNGC